MNEKEMQSNVNLCDTLCFFINTEVIFVTLRNTYFAFSGSTQPHAPTRTHAHARTRAQERRTVQANTTEQTHTETLRHPDARRAKRFNTVWPLFRMYVLVVEGS
jgi:hypothetical protein